MLVSHFVIHWFYLFSGGKDWSPEDDKLLQEGQDLDTLNEKFGKTVVDERLQFLAQNLK